MKNRSKNIVGLLLVLLIAVSCKKESYLPITAINCTINSWSHPKNTAYQAILDKYATQGVTGLSVVILKDGEVDWISSAGYASLEDNLKMTPCHLQQTASLAKSFTGVVIMQLVEEGKLSLSDPISPYLDDKIASYIPNVEAITIKHLMQQTSGIPDVFDIAFFEGLMNDPEKEYTTAELLSLLDNVKPLQAAGEKHVYSDPNFMLLSLIIDRIEGNHIQSYHNRIISPLGLTDTYYHNGGFPNPTGLVASYWDQYSNGHWENISELEIRVNNYIKGSGGVISTPMNMVQFYEAVFDGTLLNSSSVQLLKTDWVSETADQRMNTAYSHGFMVVETDEGDWIGHTGLFLGSSCYVYKNMTNGTTIGVFTNTGTFTFVEKQKLIYNDLWKDLRKVVE